ncbi:MAG: S24 family peptidase [Bacillota bacterium]|jgi:repressor LexA|nr:S24 family peptidase [Bacillota bacterium]HHU42863.1 hypothetical protein [Clostridiales bacterium]
MNKSMQRNLNNVYEFIKDFRRRYGYPPSIREIKNSLNIKSTSSVHLYLKKLDNIGLISIKGKNKSRAIDLLDKNSINLDMFCCLKNIKNINEMDIQEDEKFDFLISKDVFPSTDTLFVYKMQGNDMRDFGILNNDSLIIKRQNHAKDGDIILCFSHGKARVLRYCPYSRMNFESDAMIYGVIVGLIRLDYSNFRLNL